MIGFGKEKDGIQNREPYNCACTHSVHHQTFHYRFPVTYVLSRYYNGVSQYSHKEYSDAMHPGYALPL